MGFGGGVDAEDGAGDAGGDFDGGGGGGVVGAAGL